MIHIAKPLIGEKELKSIKEVLDSGMLAQGEIVKKFEEEFADYLGARYGKAVSNGTAALDVALKSMDIGHGDEVITSPFSFIASSNCVLFQGAKPVFSDIEEDSFNLDPELVMEKINDKTKAILVVHLFGQPANMGAFKDIAEDHGLYLIEDACQAHGAEYKGQKVGSIGDAGTFSFYPTKNMTTSEGGIVVTNDEDIDRKANLVRDHGQSAKYTHDMLGYNLRMTNIAAAIGRCQLEKLDSWNDKRIKNAEMLTSEIKKIPGLTPPAVVDGVKHVFHQYVVKVEDDHPMSREELMAALREDGVGTAVHYPMPITDQPLYIEKGYSSSDYPITVDASKKVMSLPVHPSVTEEDIRLILNSLKRRNQI
ncbi:MAG: DegT/DnrJ/EryC1/StrS family aminotransferase [Thermoplasmata archaeon]